MGKISQFVPTTIFLALTYALRRNLEAVSDTISDLPYLTMIAGTNWDNYILCYDKPVASLKDGSM